MAGNVACRRPAPSGRGDGEQPPPVPWLMRGPPFAREDRVQPGTDVGVVLAASMKPQVLTSTTLASSRSVRVQPAASSRPASSSESTSLRAQPRVTRLTVRCGAEG